MNATWEFPTAPTRWLLHESVKEVRSISIELTQQEVAEFKLSGKINKYPEVGT